MTTDHGEDPQLKLLLLSQRLTSIKRQREYNMKEIIGEPESPNSMDTDGEEIGDGNDDDSSTSLKSNEEKIYKACARNNELLDEEEDDVEQIDMLSPRRHDNCNVVEMNEDFAERRSTNHDFQFQQDEDEDEDEGDENTIGFKPLVMDKPEAACDKTGVGFSRLADYYRHPEFLHDVRKTSSDIDVDSQNDDDNPNGKLNLGETQEEVVVEAKRNASSAEKKRLPRKKSASSMKSARRSVTKSGLKQKSRQTLSGRLLDISEDFTSSSDPTVRMDALFHQCVCAFPWRCISSQGLDRSSVDAPLNEGIRKKASHTDSMNGGGAGHQFSRDDHLMGWILTKNERGAPYGYGGGGRKVSSARDSNRRRKLDPFLYHRNISDSARYTFKHYQDWEAYVDEYRRYYTVGQTGMAMKSHSIPEGGGRREAVVIVRTLSESLIRPRLQEYNIPDWDDFTDLSATPMRPLHLGPGYRSGKVPDLGVTWLAAAATAHHHEVPADYRHPATRHIRLTNIRHPETTATQMIKKRHQQALLDKGSTPRTGPIQPHDAGVKIPVEPLHIVEDFRKGSRKERHGADMQPIRCRFLASWRPSDSTRTKSAKARSRNVRDSKMDGKTSESLPEDSPSSSHDHIYSKKGSLRPLLNGQRGQTRAGLLKLFTPPKGLEVARPSSGDDITGVLTDTARQTIKNKSKTSSAAKSVDASKWTNLPSSAGKSTTEKRSATKSGTLARKPTARLHSETLLDKDFLQVRGESKKDRSQDVESGDCETSQPTSSSSMKEKDAGVFAKTRIKLVAPYAQPLAQDNVLIGSPYMASPHFGNEEHSTSVSSTQPIPIDA